MKAALIYFLNFVINPILFIDFSIWGRKLIYTPFKRQQYSLLSANLSLFPVLTYGYRQVKKQAMVIAIIFDVDYYLDQVVGKTEGYKTVISTIYDSGRYKELMKDLTKDLSESDTAEIVRQMKLLTDWAFKLDETSISTPTEYLDIASITIAMPCLTKLVSLIAKQELSDPQFMRLCSDITRIVNDSANTDKDAAEGAKNIYNLFPKSEINDLLRNDIEKLNSFQPKNKVDTYLIRLTKLGLVLYKNKDFEL